MSGICLISVFARLEDPRSGPAQRHDLREMIVIALCAVLCGAESWVDVAEWGEDNEDWLKKYLKLAHGTASHDTFGRVFRLLDAWVFEAFFREWVMSLVGVVEGVVAIDGKTVRGSQDGPNTALHMISAYATTSGLCLTQEGVRGNGGKRPIRALLRAPRQKVRRFTAGRTRRQLPRTVTGFEAMRPWDKCRCWRHRRSDIQRIPGEGIRVISANKDNYEPWTIKAEMGFQVFGRVLKVWRSEDFC